jgi:photosystem II stability/assembly factor-like uncharacterized protein
MLSIRLRCSGLLAVLALSAMALTPLGAQPARWIPLGPFGGTVTSLAIHPNDPGLLYASSNYGIIRSTDAGASWQLLAEFPGPGFVALDTSRPNTLYAAIPALSPAQVFRSVDGGSHWSAISRKLPGDVIVTALAIDSSSSGAARLYLGTDQRGVWRSVDGGFTWKPANRGLASGASSSITALAVPRRPSGTAYVGTKDGLYRTFNGGTSWTLLRKGLPAAGVEALDVSRSDPRTVYASLSGFGIYRSANGGDSWSPAGSPVPAGIPISALAVHPRSSRIVYAGSNAGGAFKTTDGGAHWTATGLPSTVRVRVLALDATTGVTLWAGAAGPDPNLTGTDPGGVLSSADGGATWTRNNNGITGLIAHSAAVDSADSDILVAGLQGLGLFRTPDGGAHWERVPVSLLSGEGSEILATAPGVFYALEFFPQQLWKSTDSGLTWNPLSRPAGQVRVLRADPVEPETLYALLGGIQASTDGGASWAPLTGAAPACFLFDLAVARPSASSPPVFYAAGSRPGGVFSACGVCCMRAAVFRNSGGGTSWTDASAGLPGIIARSVAVEPRDPQILYAGMPQGTEGVWKSADSGSSWQRSGLAGHSISALAVSPANGVVWAGSGDQIFRSSDAGATWQDLGVTPGLFAEAFVFDPFDPGRVYVTGSGGVWKLAEP